MQVSFNEIVSKRSAGQALHGYIAMCFRFVEIDWVTHIQHGGVTVNGDIADPFQMIEAGQKLTIHIPHYEEKPVDTQWELLWQSDDIIAVHKPAGLPVHRTPKHIYNTLIALVKRESEWPDAHLLHRLDTDTAGIILLGKDKAAAVQWQPNIQRLMARKIYYAVVYGKPTWRDYEFQCRLSSRDDSVIKAQMYVCDNKQEGKFSHSHFRLISSSENFSIIECEIFTGRKHQIRVQLAHLGHAIVGDKIYANNGEYYIKRLEKSLNEQDQINLKTPHHLLFASQLHLDLFNTPNTPLIIQDSYYSAQWLAFCKDHNLIMPK